MNSRRYLLGLAAVLLGGGMELFGAAKTYMLEDFANYKNRQYWMFRGIDVIVPADKNSIGASITYPQYKEGKEAFPAAILDYGNGNFTIQDWSGYSTFAFDVFNNNDCTVILPLRLDDAKGGSMLKDFELPPRKLTVCTVTQEEMAAGGIDNKQMKMMHFWMNRPEKDYALLLKNIRLTDQPYPEAELDQAVAEKLEELQQIVAELEAQGNGVFATGLLADIAKKREILTSPEEYPAKFEIIYGDWWKNLPIEVEKARFFAANNEQSLLLAVPATQKVMASRLPEFYQIPEAGITLDAAKGEAESQQLLLFAGKDALENVSFRCSDLTNQAGDSIVPELSVTGYVPVRKPTFWSFGIVGDLPDPLLPNQEFSVDAFQNQSLWMSCWVPQDAAPGIYSGTVTIADKGQDILQLPVELKVYDATLPLQSKLKSCILYHHFGKGDEYYGEKWDDAFDKEFIKLGLKYRIMLDSSGSNAVLPWNSLYSVSEDGTVTADWTEFDSAVEYWRSLGKNTFNGYYMGWYSNVDQIEEKEITFQKYRLLGEHLAEKGWVDDFYAYLFDEPAPEKVQDMKDMSNWVHDASPAINLILTSCHDNEKAYESYVDIFVPHIDFYNPEYAVERQQAGDQYWMYTCCGTSSSTYPDSWRLDYYGTGHRVLGHWLYKYKSQGYLYWATDCWNVNPWENTETFPNCNGEGTLFYPAPDKTSLPYPSIRLEMLRDAVEDYDLLHMLAEKYAGKMTPEVQDILDAKGLVNGLNDYNYLGDNEFIARHKRILELLEAE